MEGAVVRGGIDCWLERPRSDCARVLAPLPYPPNGGREEGAPVVRGAVPPR